MSTEMYRIKEEDIKIQIPCEKCTDKGIVDKSCYKCGGKGVHNKTLKIWKVHQRTVTVDKIDRSMTRDLRYWTDMSCYYLEENKLIHFSKGDATEECNKRNKDILPLLKIYENNRNQTNNNVYVIGDRFILPNITILKDESNDYQDYQKETVYTNVKVEIVDIQDFNIESKMIRSYMIKFNNNRMAVNRDYLDKLTRV